MEIGRPIIDRRFLYIIYKLENYNVELDYTCYHTTYDYIILIMIVLIATPEIELHSRPRTGFWLPNSGLIKSIKYGVGEENHLDLWDLWE